MTKALSSLLFKYLQSFLMCSFQAVYVHMHTVIDEIQITNKYGLFLNITYACTFLPLLCILKFFLGALLKAPSSFY